MNSNQTKIKCVYNSKIMRELLLLIDNEDEKTKIIEEEFVKMCHRFKLKPKSLKKLIRTPNTYVLKNNNFVSIWDSLNYYAMDILHEFRDKYVFFVQKYRWNDNRINLLCLDLKNLICDATCIFRDDICINIMDACKKGHLDCIKYFYLIHKDGYKYCELQNIMLLYTSIYYGHLNIVEFLSKDLKVVGKKSVLFACLFKKIDIMKYFLEELGVFCDDDVMNCIFSRYCVENQYEMIKYLIESCGKKLEHNECFSQPDGRLHMVVGKMISFDTFKYIFPQLSDDHKKIIYCNTINICMRDNRNAEYFQKYFQKNFQKNLEIDIIKYLIEIYHYNIFEDVFTDLIRGYTMESFEYLFNTYPEKVIHDMSIILNKSSKNKTQQIFIDNSSREKIHYLINKCPEFRMQEFDNLCLIGNAKIINCLFDKMPEYFTREKIDILFEHKNSDIIICLFNKFPEYFTREKINILFEDGSEKIIEYLYDAMPEYFTQEKIDNMFESSNFYVIKFLVKKNIMCSNNVVEQLIEQNEFSVICILVDAGLYINESPEFIRKKLDWDFVFEHTNNDWSDYDDGSSNSTRYALYNVNIYYIQNIFNDSDFIDDMFNHKNLFDEFLCDKN